MPIKQGDVVLLKSQVMADVPEGGGGPSAQVIKDGASNDIFIDVSDANRLLGNVSLRQVAVAVQTDDTDTGGRHEVKKTVHHAETGAENRNDPYLLASYPFAPGLLQRRLDFNILQRQIPGELIAHKKGDFLQKTAELPGAGVLGTHNGQLVLNQRMISNMNLHNGLPQ